MEEEPASYSPWGLKESDPTGHAHTHIHTHTHTHPPGKNIIENFQNQTIKTNRSSSKIICLRSQSVQKQVN